MHSGNGPIVGAANHTVLDRVKVTIIDLSLKIGRIADRVPPEFAVPGLCFAFEKLSGMAMRCRGQMAGKYGLYLLPYQRDVAAAGGQRPNGVDVVRQHYHRVARKWKTLHR